MKNKSIIRVLSYLALSSVIVNVTAQSTQDVPQPAMPTQMMQSNVVPIASIPNNNNAAMLNQQKLVQNLNNIAETTTAQNANIAQIQANNEQMMRQAQSLSQQLNLPNTLSQLTPEQMNLLSQELNRQIQQTKPESNISNALLPLSQSTAVIATSNGNGNGANNINTPTPLVNKRDVAFNNLVEDILPMSPEQIIQLHKFYDMTLQAKATPPNAPPEPHFSSVAVNLEPGSAPPLIRLSAGFVTSLLFIDSTGAPWPLTAYSIGDPQNFNIQWDQKSNALFIQSMKQYSHGNLAVRLNKLDTPVMVTLVSGQKNVDFRVDLQVRGQGPKARPPIVRQDINVNSNVNALIINILDGIPPKESTKLEVSGRMGEAWLVDNKIYFRSKLTVLSPAWLSTVSSPDGTHVYEMPVTSSILASRNGKTIDLKLSGL